MIVDTRSDIYSLGVTLYHMVTGIKPPGDYRVIRPLSELDLDYSQNLLRIIQKAMEPSLDLRYQSIDDMKYALVNIKKNDAEYKNVVFRQRVVGVIGACLIAAGMATGYVGYQTLLSEDFSEEYKDLVAVSSVDDYDTVISDGIELLNNEKYQNAMRKKETEKADILYMIANSYFEQDDYSRAIDYYYEAVQYNQENPEYFRDYAIALARNKNLDKARLILDQAIALGLEEDHICLVKAEISLAEENGTKAVEWFERALSMTENEYLRSRAYILCGRAYRQMGDNLGEVCILEEARTRVEAGKVPVVVRALGAAYMRYVNQLSDSAERDEYTRKSAECYQTLTSGIQNTFNDGMNLAICYEMLGEYDLEENTLSAMEKNYPDDYRVYMREALMHFSVESEKEESTRDYAIVETYYEKALTYYEHAKNSGESDENMQYLESVISELKQKGWLT